MNPSLVADQGHRDIGVVHYADDTIIGFEREHEAQAFLHDLQERMRAFDLSLHADKTRLIVSGAPAPHSN